MMKRVLKLGFAALGAALGVGLLACTQNGGSAGTTFETENDIALTVFNDDGSPASNARVLVRRVDYMGGTTNRDLDDDYSVSGESSVGATDTTMGIFNALTDINGQVSIKAKMRPTNYVVEVRGKEQKGIYRVSITERDSLYPIELSLESPGSVSGQVYLPKGVRSATVSVQGIDYFVQTDTLGRFEFESLPAGTFNVVGIVYSEQVFEKDGETEVVSMNRTLGFVSTKVRSEKETVNLKIGSAPIEDTVVVPEYQFETFENGVANWYTTVARYASATISSVDAGEGREGKVALLDYHNDSLYNWALMGYAFPKMEDFSDLDSVALWVRGTADNDTTQWISVSFDVLVDSTSEFKSGKAWAHVRINNKWKRYVITPDDFQDSTDTNGGNLGWEAVKSHVTNFNIFGGGGTNKIWVDDIEIYGIKNLDRP